MKELMGKTVVIGVEGGKFKGEVIADFPDRIVIAQSDNNKVNVVNILKTKLSYFAIQEDKTLEELREFGTTASAPPLTILGCQNPSLKCSGVRFVAEKRESELMKEDFEKFMSPCTMRKESCKCGSIGNLINTKADILIDIFSGLLVGEYPTEPVVPSKFSKLNKNKESVI